MRLKDESSRGRMAAGFAGDSATLSAMSVGLASMVAATGAAAQQAAEPATDLPPLEVTAKKAAKKKTVAKKAQPTSPVPQAYAPETPAEAEDTPEGQTGAFTPESGNNLQAGTGLGRLPGSIQSTPQIVNVVPAEQLKQQNVSSVEQALRSVPGVTIGIGEGNGGLNGDQFRIRGFEAKGDLYVDGLRDFGVYVRDSFATEEVQVLKGPSSESFGPGTTGGAINLRQKSAHLGDASNFNFSIGTDSYYRGTVDVNKQVNSTTAMRGVAMYHSQDIPDRDHVDSERYGFLGSIGFGLGTDTTWVVNYLHQTGDQKPDMGVPNILGTNASRGQPATELGVDRSAYYGRAQDHDETQADIITSRFQTKVNDQVTFYNDTRLAFYSRDFSATIPGCANGNANPPSTCADDFLAGGNPNVSFGGGNPTYEQDNWGFQNISSAVARFHTGFLKHEAVAGVDVFYQENDRAGYSISGKTANSPIRNPGIRYHDRYTVTRNPNADRFMDGTEVGLFASDRVWFTPELSVLGGIRWSHFEYAYSQPGATPQPIDRTSEGDYWSPKVSVIWEPTQQQTYYFSWATSASPLGAYVGNAAQPITNDAFEGEVEENESFEVGAKFSLLGDRLGFTTALFQVEKGNAVVSDDAGNPVFTGEEQRVRGVEFGLAGQLTRAWAMNAAVTFMESKILDSATAANIGNEIGGVPDTAISLWTTYNLSDSIISGPGTWLIGGGILYQSEMFAVNNSANQYLLPETFSLDAMVSYELDGWRFALNGYNLTDELYYSSSFNNRATPAAGRSAVFTIGKSF